MPLPSKFADVEALEDFMTAPSEALKDDLAAVSGNILVLGAGGKMGPTLARMAKRAAPDKTVMAVARFSDPAVRERLTAQGVECHSCDLTDREAIAGIPGTESGFENVVFMAGHKFGASADPSYTWAMNVAVPYMVAERFANARIVAFSTACVYPFVPVSGPGATEDVAAIPPPGDYAASCVGREKMFEYGSRKWQTPGALVRLSYAIDTRYGVLYDVARKVIDRQAINVSMGHADVIWQGDANEQSLRLLRHCTTPTRAVNITGPEHTSIRWLAAEFGKRLGVTPVIEGTEADTAWLEDTTLSQSLFGRPAVGIDAMIDWVADWVQRDQPALGKPTHFSARDGKY